MASTAAGPRATARSAAVGIHQRRGHAARGVPGPALGAGRGAGEPGATSQADFDDLRPVGLPRLGQRRHGGRVRVPTSRSTRGSSWPRSATRSADDILRDAFATKEFRKVLQPMIGMETFNAGPRWPPPTTSSTRDRRARSARIAWFDDPRRADRARPAGARRHPATARRRRGGARSRPGDGRPGRRSTGAVGYLVHRGVRPDGPWAPIDHKGGDVLAVPHGPYVDTHRASTARRRLRRGEPVQHRGARRPRRRRRSQASRRPSAEGAVERSGRCRDASIGAGPPAVAADASAPSTSRCCLRGEGPGGLPVGRRAGGGVPRSSATELGVRGRSGPTRSSTTSLGVYPRGCDGPPRYDFDKVDLALDRLLATGLRPLVELSFMPSERSPPTPGRAVFDYRGIISPPRDLDRWAGLVEALVRHLVARYGADEVSRCGLRGLERAEHQGLLGRPPEPTTSTCTTRPRGRSRQSIRDCRWAGHRRPPPAGSTTCCHTPPRPACRSTS